MTTEALILAVETSSRVGSVALARGPVVLAEKVFSAPLQHSAEIFPAISQLLDRFDCRADSIAQVHIAVGPGSFTGLRIAVTIAKTLHLANSATIVAVDSLDVIAANVDDGPCGRPLRNSEAVMDHIAVVLDAKRGEFYAAVYRRADHAAQTNETPVAEHRDYEIPAPGDRIWRKIGPDCLTTADELFERFAGQGPLGLVGDGLLYRRGEFSAEGVHILSPEYWSPRASNVHHLGYQKARAGLFANPLTLTPFYLRGPHVTLRGRA